VWCFELLLANSSICTFLDGIMHKTQTHCLPGWIFSVWPSKTDSNTGHGNEAETLARLEQKNFHQVSEQQFLIIKKFNLMTGPCITHIQNIRFRNLIYTTSSTSLCSLRIGLLTFSRKFSYIFLYTFQTYGL